MFKGLFKSVLCILVVCFIAGLICKHLKYTATIQITKKEDK